MSKRETIVAPSTPPGESALAVVRVSGPLALDIASSLRGGKGAQPRRLWHCDYRTMDGSVLDDVVCSLFAGPASYTGDDVLEISCHGSPLIIRRICEDLRSRGCRAAEPGEFTRRAFENGKIDLTRAEAVIDVIRARSDRALEVAQRQLRGDLGRRIDTLVARVLDTCASIEAYIDFPEEDLPPEDRLARQSDVEAIVSELRQLRASRRQHDLLREGVRVVIVGEPNVGKSSILNRFSGYERAIVDPAPGTTRDFVEEGILIGRHRVRMLDTAGIRETAEAVESAGVSRTFSQVEQADLLLLVADVTAPAPTLPESLARRVGPENSLLVVNKIDLAGDGVSAMALAGLDPVSVSAITGAGFAELEVRIAAMLDRLTGTGEWDEGVSVNERHSEALEDAINSLSRCRDLLKERAALELAASEMRSGVHALGRIVGAIDNESVLDRLFARFCIGK